MKEKINLIFKDPELDNTEIDIFVVSLYISMMITQTIYITYREGNLDTEKIRRLYGLLQEKMEKYKDWERAVIALTQLALETTLLITATNFNRVLDKIKGFAYFQNEEIPQSAVEKFEGVILVEAVKMTILKLISLAKVLFPEKRDAKLAPILRIVDFNLAQRRLGEDDPFEDFLDEYEDSENITREDVLLLSTLLLIDSGYIFPPDDTFENVYITAIINSTKKIKEERNNEGTGEKN